MSTRARLLPLALVALGVLSLGHALPARGQSNEMQGIQPVGSSTTGIRPVTIGGSDGAGKSQAAALETGTNCLQVTTGVNYVLEPPQKTGLLTSNGTTAVTIASGVAGKRSILVGGILWNNNGSGVTHNVDIIDSTNPSVIILRIPLVAGSGYDFAQVPGLVQTVGSGSLQFKIDSGGTSTDVTGTLLYLQK